MIQKVNLFSSLAYLYPGTTLSTKINFLGESDTQVAYLRIIALVNIALKEAFFARMKKVSPKVFQVCICIKHCTNFDSNSGKMRAGKVFYAKLKAWP